MRRFRLTRVQGRSLVLRLIARARACQSVPRDVPLAVLGRQLAEARVVENRHRAARPGLVSPLKGVIYGEQERDLLVFTESPLDDRIAKLCADFERMTAEQRAETRAALTMDDFQELATFTRRCVLCAVRENDPVSARHGLLAISMISIERTDWRDVAWATAIARYGLLRTQSVEATRSDIAAIRDLADEDVARCLDEFLPTHETEVSLHTWGMHEVVLDGRITFVKSNRDDYAPSIDLVAPAAAVMALLRADRYKHASITVATSLNEAWLSPKEAQEILALLARSRATVSVGSFGDGPSALMVWLIEAHDEVDATDMARLLDGRPRKGYATLVVASRTLVSFVVASSWIAGKKLEENRASLKRFAPRLAEILAGATA